MLVAGNAAAAAARAPPPAMGRVMVPLGHLPQLVSMICIL